MDNFVTSDECRICSTPNSSPHLCIEACKACATFFKRAQQSGARYQCRKGDRQCTVLRAEGWMCRGCRYDRCAAIGMLYDGPMRTNNHTLNEVYLATVECAIDILNITVFECWNFFLPVIPSLAELPHEDQQPDSWIGEEDGGPNRQELLESIRVHIQDQMTKIVPSFLKADFCEHETHAFLALLLCDPEPGYDVTNRVTSFLEIVRSDILKDLHRFYIEQMRLCEYSTRLGRLLTLCHTFREGNTLFQEFFRMQVTIFDLYVTHTMLQDLLL